MYLVGLAVFIFIIAFIVLGFVFDPKTRSARFKLNGRQILAFGALLVLPFAMVATVPVNSVGIVFNPFNGVSDEVLQEGIHVKSPFDEVYIISTEVQTKTVANVSGQTKDAQWINITMDIKYRVSETNAFEVFKRFKTLSNVDSNLLSPLVQRAIESVTTKYNVIDILGEKRNQVYIEIENEVEGRLAESGIEFFSLVLMDTDAGAAIESAIEREAVAKKEVETARQAQEKARIEAETRVIESEGAARIKLIEAQAAADANALLSKSITPEILKKMEMEARIKWGWIEVSGANVIVDTTP
ncbi:MAG: B-cell receptor associated protein-related protein [Erysipelotrichaceae bacterium]|nr:MAG: B-cell receptor associated protein-related [Erysipelotrichaceae bacterium]TXT18381.1 MAG: B-cell receptor associated protein-related protein [Erysipelotrichaceae bacterium]